MAGERMGNNMQVSEPNAKYMVKVSEYKLTEAGLIPNDWVASTIGKEFHIELGKMLDSEKNTGLPKPFLGNRSVQWGKIDTSSLGEIRLTPQDIQKYRLQKGDLLACEGGEIGRSAIWEAQLDECYYQKALHRLRPKNGLSTQLLLNILRRSSFLGDLNNFVTQTSIAHLPKEKFQTVPIAFPSSPAEQQAIATALSDTDALIDALEQLLAKKRQVKQGVLQELLTGNRRAFENPSQAAKKRVADVCHMKSGSTITAENLSDHAAFRCFGGNGLRGYTSTYTHDGNYALIGRQGALCGNVFYASGKFFASEHAIVVTPKIGTDIRWLAHILRRLNLNQYSESSAQPGLSVSKILSLPIQTPSLQEQTAIAAILSDMDTDITELETRIGKVRQVKQGMMRELLTGRTRLV